MTKHEGMMKHISRGRRNNRGRLVFDRICGTPVSEKGEYVSDEEWRKLPECPECFGKNNFTLAPQEPKVDKCEAQPKIITQGLYLRQYLE